MKQNTAARNAATVGRGNLIAKPEYRVLSMAEIEALPWNGYNVISTFSGCGGSCLGYRMAGYRVLWANEFIPAAQDSYKANHPNSILDPRDIRKIQPEEILEAIGLGVGEVDIFDGSPPCAAFSTAGKKEKGWGKVKQYSSTKQRVDDLFFEYARILKGIQPKVFVAENVSGLIKGTAKGYFLEILKALKECGYQVKCKLLNAKWLGVPQTRERTIFVGTRNDLNIEPTHPKPLPYWYSVKDALQTLNSDKSAYHVLRGKYKELYLDTQKFKISDFGKSHERLFGKRSCFDDERCIWDLPSYTIKQSRTNIYHPDEPRSFSINELKRVCSFPDDFILTGTPCQQWERLGRAVPPVMMMHIAKEIEKEILNKIRLTRS